MAGNTEGQAERTGAGHGLVASQGFGAVSDILGVSSCWFFYYMMLFFYYSINDTSSSVLYP